MSFQRYGWAKRRGSKTAYYVVHNYHYNGREIERQTTNYKEAMSFARETPKSHVTAYDADGWVIGSESYSPANVPLSALQLAKRAREKSGHRNRSGGRISHAWPPGAPIGHGFYRVSDKFAGQLARGVGKKLPSHGHELRVALEDGRLAWLQRTPVTTDAYGFKAPKHGWVWALHGIEGYS
jgi:hypothetical protein